MRPIRPHPPLVLFAAAFVALAHACKNAETGAVGSLCNPGDDIFCRCQGGDPGTKTCNEPGDAFGECGPCEERPSTGPGEQSSSGDGGFGAEGGAGPGSGGGGGLGDNPLLSFCNDNGDCQSGTCRFHFCTKTCKLVSECPYPASECVKYDDSTTMCMPSCATAVSCALYQAPPSLCGYTQAIDNWDVTVCAEWGSAHKLMPVGTDCLPFDHPACNLGYQGRELVCSEAGVCTKGCYLNADCPMAKICSSQGALGTCQ